MAESTQAISASAASEHGFVRAIGLFDGTMIVVGSMIGSGIFIVAADISRQTARQEGFFSPGFLRDCSPYPPHFLTVNWRLSFHMQGANMYICAKLIRRCGDFFMAGRFFW